MIIKFGQETISADNFHQLLHEAGEMVAEDPEFAHAILCTIGKMMDSFHLGRVPKNFKILDYDFTIVIDKKTGQAILVEGVMH